MLPGLFAGEFAVVAADGEVVLVFGLGGRKSASMRVMVVSRFFLERMALRDDDDPIRQHGPKDR